MRRVGAKGGEGQVAALKDSIGTHILSDAPPEQEVRDSAAGEIREMADGLPTHGHWASLIDMEVAPSGLQGLPPPVAGDRQDPFTGYGLMTVGRSFGAVAYTAAVRRPGDVVLETDRGK